MIFEYLLFNCIIILCPLLALCIKKSIIKPKIKPTLQATIITAIIFITYDLFATPTFWEFNRKFILGIYIANLPIEEILFFITVPIACILVYENIKIYSKTHGEISIRYIEIITIILTIIAIYGVINKKYYTGTIALIGMTAIMWDMVLLKTRILKTKQFAIYTIIIIILTTIFNWYLTARPIVKYTPSMKTNLYILTIPIEDFIFGMAMITYHTTLYTYFTQLTKYSYKENKNNIEK